MGGLGCCIDVLSQSRKVVCFFRLDLCCYMRKWKPILLLMCPFQQTYSVSHDRTFLVCPCHHQYHQAYPSISLGNSLMAAMLEFFLSILASESWASVKQRDLLGVMTSFPRTLRLIRRERISGSSSLNDTSIWGNNSSSKSNRYKVFSIHRARTTWMCG